MSRPTAATPGRTFSVTFDAASKDATWTKLDTPGGSPFPDFPATDFGVLRLPSGLTDWQIAGAGLPQFEVAGLTIVSGARKLYAATHGRGAWQLTLP